MKKEFFKEIFEYYIKVREQVEKYDKLMLETFNEKRDDDYTNWYEQAAYDHAKKIFNLNYKDEKDEWFDYFIFECLYPCIPNTEPRVVSCSIGFNNKDYVLDNVDNFYTFCEEQLTEDSWFEPIN